MQTDKLSTVPKVLTTLARFFDTQVINWRLTIPEQYGSGYCTGFVFNESIRLLILNYELKDDLVVDNPDVNALGNRILFKFQNVLLTPNAVSKQRAIPSVLLVTSPVNLDLVIPIHRQGAVINVEVEASYLQKLVSSTEKSLVLQSLSANQQPLLFEEVLFPALQPIVDELVNEAVDESFELFFRRVKVEELICRLLMAMAKRSEKQLYSLNNRDIQTLYQVKEHMLDRLEQPPVISELAQMAHMSPTKLKRLFKQIFGDSIFQYYQAFRIKEAARLLKADKRSVSEVGYQLGFTNLSHFSRVFEEQMGIKPKKYVAS